MFASIDRHEDGRNSKGIFRRYAPHRRICRAGLTSINHELELFNGQIPSERNPRAALPDKLIAGERCFLYPLKSKIVDIVLVL